MTRPQKIRLPGYGDQKARNEDVSFEQVLATFPWRNRPADARTELRDAIELVRVHTDLRTADRGRRRNDLVRQHLIDLEALSLAVARSIGRLSPSPLPPSGFLGDPRQGAPTIVLSGLNPDVLDPIGAKAGEIAITARLLASQISAFRAQFNTDPDRSKADMQRHEFVQVAATVWDTVAAKPATASRSGPFARFCAMAWLECDFPAPDTDTISTIGAVVERVLKYRRNRTAQLR